jgi:hypothetical protein
MSGTAGRSRIGRALATGVAVAGIVVASIVGLDGWADQAATRDASTAVATTAGGAPVV